MLLTCIFLFLYIFSIPSFSGRVNLKFFSYIAMACLALCSLLYILIFDRQKFFDKRVVFLILFATHCLFSTLLFSNQFRTWLTIALMVLTCIIFLWSFSCINNYNLILNIIVGALSLFCIYFIIHYRNEIFMYTSLDKDSSRLGKFFDNVNQIGSYMSVGVALSAFYLLFLRGKRNMFMIVPLALFIVVGFLTGSRTFLLSVVLIFSTLLFLLFKKNKFLFFIIFAALILIFIIFINLPFMSFLKNQFLLFFKTFTGNTTNSSDISAIQRVVWQEYGFNLGSFNLIFGYGQDGFSIYSNTGSYSHANFSELMCNFGVIGFVLFYSIFILNFCCALKSKSIYRNLIFTIVVFYICSGFLLVFYYQKDTYLILALMIFLNQDTSFKQSKPDKMIDSLGFMEVIC